MESRGDLKVGRWFDRRNGTLIRRRKPRSAVEALDIQRLCDHKKEDERRKPENHTKRLKRLET